MDNETVRNWWINQHRNQYFTAYSFGFSYPKMSRFNLKDKTILDYANGYGRETSEFCELSPSVYGIDICKEANDFCLIMMKEQNIKNLSKLGIWDGLDLNTFPFENTKFDFIYSCFVIQHMSKHNAKKVIENCLKLLNDNGRIFFEFFGHPDFMGGEGKDAFSGGPETGMYNNGYTYEEIIRLVKDLPCEIDFIDKWELAEQNGHGVVVPFNNYWVCLKRKGGT
jgi:SAM-dependent methyltransferase